MSDDEKNNTPPTRGRKGETSMNAWIMLALLVGWIVLQVWVLPRFGVST